MKRGREGDVASDVKGAREGMREVRGGRSQRRPIKENGEMTNGGDEERRELRLRL